MNSTKSMMAGLMVALSATGVWGRENVVFVSAHPDDTEGFAATAFRLVENYNVHIVDFTGGERGLGEAAFLDGSCKAKRKLEEEAACDLLGARLYWLGQIDGESVATQETINRLGRLLKELKPRAVFAHWPIDAHGDHIQASVAAQRAVSQLKARGIATEFYFFEVQMRQTTNWHPVYSVDVTESFPRKVDLLRKYVCQNVEDGIVKSKTAQAALRGRQRQPACQYAETFATYDGQPIPGGVLETLPGTVRIGSLPLASK